MELRRKLALNLRRLRHERGLSQEEFADQAGLHRTHVSMIERLTRNPSLDVLEKIAKALDVKAADLLE